MSRKKTTAKEATPDVTAVVEEEILQDAELKLKHLNEMLQAAGYEIAIRRPVRKEIVKFDLGLCFTRTVNDAGAHEVQVYVDEDLQLVIDRLLKQSEEVIVKVNWFSPDLLVLTSESVDTDMLFDAPVASTETPAATIDLPAVS